MREQNNFSGVIISDWLIMNDCDDECVNGSAPDKKPVAAKTQHESLALRSK
ncbi:hypothetical protein JTF19_11590 [Enterobacteriaceae bacterium RIT814]|nr:hypothetical protein [Enterobacteriaceae bacterium RIT 814]